MWRPALVLAEFQDEVWEIERETSFNPDLQAVLLWHLAAEALALARFALTWRASVTALAQIRIVSDAYCMLRWLTEPEDVDVQMARTVGLVLSELDDTKRMAVSLEAAARDAEQKRSRTAELENLIAYQAGLEEFVRADGVTPERPPEPVKSNETARW